MEERLVKLAKIVDAGSFTRAARLMHISQPALTAAVQKLERELGADLLVRGRHALSLTAAGKVAYDTGKTLLAETQNLQLHISEAAKQKTAINLGLIDSIGELLFSSSQYLQALEEHARLSLTIDNSGRLVHQVERDELDVAFIAAFDRLPSTLHAEVIAPEPLVFVTHPDVAMGVQNSMKQQGLVPTFLNYNQGSRTAEYIARHFANQSIILETTFHSTSPEIMLQLVLAKRGSAVLPYQLVRTHLKDSRLQTIHIGKSPLVLRPIVRVHRKGRALSAQIERSSHHIREQLHDLYLAAQQI